MRASDNQVTKRSYVGDAEFDDRIFMVVLGTTGIVSVVLGVFLIIAVAVGVFVLKNFAFC